MFEKLFYNAEVIGMDGDKNAILVQGEKIAVVGSRRYCLNRAGSEVQQIDCKGRTIVPGFADSHCHLVETGDTLLQPELKGKSLSELMIIIQNASRRESVEGPFIAMGLDDEQFNQLRKQREDFVNSDHGLLIFHSSGHCAIADPQASRRLHRNLNGRNSVIIDEPYEDPQILMILQRRKHQDTYLERCIRKGIESYLSAGVTSLHDNTWDPEVFRYMSGMVRGIDIRCWSKGNNILSRSNPIGEIIYPQNISEGPAKFFLDGAFYNSTAWLWEPYRNMEDWCGNGHSADEIAKMAEPLIARKRQCIFHAAGDRAISELCTALEGLLSSYPWIPELRIRIEHAQLIEDRDYDRIRNLGMVISAQPGACCNPDRDIEFLGEKRAERAYSHRRIVDENIPLAIGSDFPFEDSMDPFLGIKRVTERTFGDSLKTAEALKAYTEGCAYADFSEMRKGRIEEGFQADFFVTSENPLEGIRDGKDAILSVYSRGLCVLDNRGNV